MRLRWLIWLMLIPLCVKAQQDSIIYTQDTTKAHTKYKYRIDLTKKPDAMKAVWLGAIAPGAGQIYNGSYWKLPIVYGAFMGCGYAIGLNNNLYTNYKTAYLDLYNDIEANRVSEDRSKSYVAIMPDGYNMTSLGEASGWLNTIKNSQSTYRRYRDYAVLATVLVYALSLVDAYVDAQLFDYDISPDLSIHAEPQIYYDLQQHQQSAELKLAIRF